MPYTIAAEFAGTKEEARSWAKENGFNYAKRLGTSPNAFPFVSLSGPRVDTIGTDISRFNKEGWPHESLTIKVGNKERR